MTEQLTATEQNALRWVTFCERIEPYLHCAWDDPGYNKHNVIAKVLGTMHLLGHPVSDGTEQRLGAEPDAVADR